jgi:hypothetical protein
MKKSLSSNHTKLSLKTNAWFNKNLGLLGVVVVILVLLVYMIVMRMDSMNNRIIQLEGNDINRTINEINGSSPEKMEKTSEKVDMMKQDKMMKY